MLLNSYLLAPVMPWLIAMQLPLAFWHGVAKRIGSAADISGTVIPFPRRHSRPCVDFGERRMSAELIQFEAGRYGAAR